MYTVRWTCGTISMVSTIYAHVLASTSLYGVPVGHGCHDMHIWDLWTCISAICRLAHTQFAEMQLFPCGCNMFATWLQHVFHVVATWQPHGNNCISANRVCASPQIPDVHACMSANPRCARPQIADVHVCTSANHRCARHDSHNLPGHRILGLKRLHTLKSVKLSNPA